MLFKPFKTTLIKGRTLEEKQLFSDVEKLLKLSHNFRQRIKFAESTWDTEMEAIRLLKSQVAICETISDLVKEQKHGEAFILSRTLFENYLLICLILKGTKYVLTYKVPREPDESPKAAYNRISKKLEERKDIVSFRPIRNYHKVEIVHRGLFSEKGDKITPIYHFVFQRYDPIAHRIDRISSIVETEFYPEITSKWQKTHEALYKTYFGFGNLLDEAVLNNVITDDQRVRMKVHYNFLSAFTHLTKLGFELSMPYEYGKHRHYLTELNLLYVLRTLRLYVLLLIEFFSNTQHRIEDKTKVVGWLNKLGKRYDYFWFIFNEPSEYDQWKSETTRAYRRRRGEQVTRETPYYRNPYQRLREQHRTTNDLLTRLTYTSPWPRHDAIP